MRALLVATLALMLGCVGPSTEVPLEQDFQLGLGQTVTIAGTGQQVTFEAVPEDSRCPVDAVCIWAGNARVALRVSSAGVDSSLALNTGSEPKTATLGKLRLELRGLEPAPRAATPTPPQAYRVTLRVTGL